MDKLPILAQAIENTITAEQPARILEIGGGYGNLLEEAQARAGVLNGTAEHMTIQDFYTAAGSAYDAAGDYDLIIITDLSGQIEPEKARTMLDALQYKVTKQILIFMPLSGNGGYREYHPVIFLGLDFCYRLIGEGIQAYSVFPKKRYKPLACDAIPQGDEIQKLKIAVILPHQNLTGGMKALLQQIKRLTRKGHTVEAYLRSGTAKRAIPAWSGLTDSDCAKQTVIAPTERYLDHIRGADVILLGWMMQAPEFFMSKIPVALWEQGSEMLYGDFRAPIFSMSDERRVLHGIYRLPVHLLAVSVTNIAALKGIYNRDAFLFPNGIDVDFYHPARKNNGIPVVLLVGNPALSFKGFGFAFEVLTRAYASGVRFRVQWASQVPVRHSKTNFPLKVFVNPPQKDLAGMYRNADVFLSASLYESYPLPPLEAMASGTAVLAADCGGIRTYAEDGVNCVLCRQGDVSAMARELARLVDNSAERYRLAAAGRKTAIRHSAERTVEILEKRLTSIVRHHSC